MLVLIELIASILYQLSMFQLEPESPRRTQRIEKSLPLKLNRSKKGQKCIVCSRTPSDDPIHLYAYESQRRISICSNNHKVCLRCLLKLSSVYSMCPQCKEVFDLIEIEKTMPYKRSFCPYPHFYRSFKNKLNYCSNCGSHVKVKYTCGQCSFNVCSPCMAKWHDKFCNRCKTFHPKDRIAGSRLFRRQRDTAHECCKCLRQSLVGQSCSYCQIFTCFDCSGGRSKIV